MKTLQLLVLVTASLTGLAGCGHKQAASSAEAPAAVAGQILVTHPNGDIKAETKIGDCSAALTYRPTEPYTMRYENACPQLLADKLNLFSAMIGAVFGPGGPPAEITSLYVGLLSNTFPEIGQRVVLASADKSKRKLDKAREKGQINNYYAEIASDKDNYPELQEVFDHWGFDVLGVSVEKVMIGNAAQTRFAAVLTEKGVDPGYEFPYDAQTWFKLRPKPRNGE